MRNVKNKLIILGMAWVGFACSQKTRDLSIQEGTLPGLSADKDEKEHKDNCPNPHALGYDSSKVDPSCAKSHE